MATFTCSACGFSKPVKDEMAGKKARCPKCNEVNDIPELEAASAVAVADTAVDEEAAQEQAAVTTPAVTTPAAAVVPPAEQEVSAAAHVEDQPVAAAASAPSEAVAAGALPKLSKGWILGFAGSGVLLVLAAVLLVIQKVDFALICFAVGTLLFCALSVMFVFADSFGKKK